MDYYTSLKQDIRDDLFSDLNKIENFSDLIEIQIELMSWYRHSYCCLKNGSITNDEAITIGCSIKNVIRCISYSLYHNEILTSDVIVKLFDDNIEVYENN